MVSERRMPDQENGAYKYDYAIKELFDETVSTLGITLDEEVEVRPRTPDDAFTILLDPSKTNQDFDWKVSTPLSEGIYAAVEYYKEFGISQTFTHLRLEEKSCA